MYTLTIQIPNLLELQRVTTLLGHPRSITGEIVVNSSEQVETSKSKKEAKTKTTEEKIAPPVIEFPVSYDDMKAQVLEVAKVKGREASIDLLVPFGVVTGEGAERKAKVGNVKVEDYAAVIDAAKKVLNS